MDNIDHDPEKFEQDEHGNLYPIDADSVYGVTLESLRDKPEQEEEN